VSAATAIEARGATKRYGATLAVDRVDLAIREGAVFGLIGHNGAGKSTLIRMMLGLLAPDAGEIRVAGATVQGERSRNVRRRVAYLPENVVFYDNLSGLETLRFYAGLKGASPAVCRGLLEEVGLGAAAGRPVRGYSKGMRQRLGFAQALLGEPRILFLDEPTTGLDPSGIREFYVILGALRARGVTVVLSSHNLAEIQERVDALALMRNGRIRAAGTVAELRRALDLPVRIRLQVSPEAADALSGVLASIAGCSVALDAGRAEIRCAYGARMAVLAALFGSGIALGELQILEPSLEDVFLGYESGAG
jgi:Cu-processing system ATP-binding protein